MAQAINNSEERDLVLTPGSYLYMQDSTRGQIKVWVGSAVVSQTGADSPIKFDPNTRSFQKCKLENAVVQCPFVAEGEYLILENPATNNEHPEEGGARLTPELRIGKKVNIPGPCNFALWPLQKAQVLSGHRLRSYQYLFVRVYNEEEANKNWTSAITKPATEKTEVLAKENLTLGKILVVKGSDVSFYIPPTGIEVVPDDKGNYVRDAVILERLEYCILINESGNKRYERGPQVVFPKADEHFYSEENQIKFKALELSPIQGLHIKVIEDYDDKKAGQELFLTGETDPIYFPKGQHSVIKHGDNEKYHPTAIPLGEGRYVMNRTTGEIITEKGPKMLLPDPRNFVIVRRVLSDKQCRLWYPGNLEALAYNQSLRTVAQQSPSARSGFVSEGDVKKSLYATASNASFGESVTLCDSSARVAGAQSFNRNIQYAPKAITLDTKFEGVPSITVWTGYAVMVVSKDGKRRVVEGPQTILLDYDETLENLQLSTGKPKTTDKLEESVFLRIRNNKVSDILSVKTKDGIDLSLKLSYRVNFDGDPYKWFQVENYVKLLCDHCRSILKGVAQKTKVEDFYQDGISIIRNAILGESLDGVRDGMRFEENGMLITDLEVLDITINNKEIAELLNVAQGQIVRSNIQLHQAQKDLEVVKVTEQINREKAEASNLTKRRIVELSSELAEIELSASLTKVNNDIKVSTEQERAEEAREAVKNVTFNSELTRVRSKLEQQYALDKSKSELKVAEEQSLTDAMVKRFQAMQPGFSEALLQLQSQDTLTKIAQALSAQQLAGGKNIVDIVHKLFEGSGAEHLLANVVDRMKINT